MRRKAADGMLCEQHVTSAALIHTLISDAHHQKGIASRLKRRPSTRIMRVGAREALFFDGRHVPAGFILPRLPSTHHPDVGPIKGEAAGTEKSTTAMCAADLA